MVTKESSLSSKNRQIFKFCSRNFFLKMRQILSAICNIFQRSVDIWWSLIRPNSSYLALREWPPEPGEGARPDTTSWSKLLMNLLSSFSQRSGFVGDGCWSSSRGLFTQESFQRLRTRLPHSSLLYHLRWDWKVSPWSIIDQNWNANLKTIRFCFAPVSKRLPRSWTFTSTAAIAPLQFT